jgi:hypothetical protein
LFAVREVVISSFFREKFLNNLKKLLSEYLECASDSFFLNCIFVHHGHIELFTVIEDVNGIDILFLKIGELLILDQFRHISFELSLEKDLEIVDVDLFVDSLNDLFEDRLIKGILELSHVKLLVLHIDKFVIKVLISFLKIQKLERTAKEKCIFLVAHCHIDISLDELQIGRHE